MFHSHHNFEGDCRQVYFFQLKKNTNIYFKQNVSGGGTRWSQMETSKDKRQVSDFGLGVTGQCRALAGWVLDNRERVNRCTPCRHAYKLYYAFLRCCLGQVTKSVGNLGLEK